VLAFFAELKKWGRWAKKIQRTNFPKHNGGVSVIKWGGKRRESCPKQSKKEGRLPEGNNLLTRSHPAYARPSSGKKSSSNCRGKETICGTKLKISVTAETSPKREKTESVLFLTIREGRKGVPSCREKAEFNKYLRSLKQGKRKCLRGPVDMVGKGSPKLGGREWPKKGNCGSS